jgi:adenylosuccinate synthase
LDITKAYCTRMGGGPFPSELDIATVGTPGRQMSEKGREFGTVTGRARRCGWFDAALLRRSAQINGLSGLCVTKLDVLDGLETLDICVGYRLEGRHIDLLPIGADEVARCEPVFETLPGWTERTNGVKRWEDLPQNARAYLTRLETLCQTPIAIISTGPERAETIVRQHPFG